MKRLLPASTLVFCPDYREILNNSFEKFNVNNVTVEQIFKLTPEFDEVIVSCEVRNVASFLIQSTNASKCIELFNFDRFFLTNYICYRLTLKNTASFDTEIIGNAIESLGVVYKLNILRSSLVFNRCMFISFHGSYPYYSRKLTQDITSEIDGKTKIPLFNRFIIRYKLYVTSLLPVPYDTMCVDSHDYFNSIAYEKCLSHALGKYNRIPFQTIIRHPSDLKPFTIDDLNNRTLNDAVQMAQIKCHRLNRGKKCSYNFSITQVTQDMSSHDHLEIINSIPIDPTVVIETDPRIDLCEFILYILSILGIWFGFHCASVSPKNAGKIATTTRSCMQNHLFVSTRDTSS